MNQTNSDHIFNQLRKKHPYLVFERFNILRDQQSIKIRFEFNLSGDVLFSPQLSVDTSFHRFDYVSDESLENLAFHIGMIELVSYWKAACPPEVIVRPYALDESQIAWWKKLWFYGLGEFFYTNGIHADQENFVKITATAEQSVTPFSAKSADHVLVPVGGGKDSVVTLELLKRAGYNVIPFILNPRDASVQTAINAGFRREEILVFNRTIDPKLLDLNAKGYLNGHTPFSALLAFITLLAAEVTGTKYVALSNESSANEPTIPGTHVNHQYSKSVDFEKDFRDYISDYVTPDIEYFSFLRPLNELRIGRLFSLFPQHFDSFRSCNVGSKTGVWCGKCPKCLFTRIILGPFIPEQKMTEIFGKELFDDPELKQSFDELTGIAGEKPFECVGTVDEVNAALHHIIDKKTGTLPYLLNYYSQEKTASANTFNDLMTQFDPVNFLPPAFESILKSAL